MTENSYRLDGPRDGRFVVALFGELDEPKASVLEQAVTQTLAPAPPASLFVEVDLTGLEDCNIFARSVLVRVQQVIAVKAKRTAYLSDRPRFRGLALWVMHLAEDGNARAVVSREQLDEWLSSSSERIDDAERRFNSALASRVKGGAR